MVVCLFCYRVTESELMLVTVVYIMYQAIEWLHQWRSSVRCIPLIYEHLRHSSVIVRRTDDSNVPYNELSSLISDGRHALSTAHVLWTHGNQQLAVMTPQVKPAALMLITANIFLRCDSMPAAAV